MHELTESMQCGSVSNKDDSGQFVAPPRMRYSCLDGNINAQKQPGGCSMSLCNEGCGLAQSKGTGSGLKAS